MKLPDNLPRGIPPLPPNTRYGGLVRDIKTDCRAFYHAKSKGNFWIGIVDLCAYDGPPGSSGDWHVALPTEAVREPAKGETCPKCAAERTYYDGWNCPTEVCDLPADVESAAIIAATLKALPVGYLPAHTPESIPERVADLVARYAEAERERVEWMDRTTDALAKVGILTEQRDEYAATLRVIAESNDRSHHEAS